MFSIFSDECFLSACLVLLTAAEDVCNEKGGVNSKGRCSDGETFWLFRAQKARRGGLH